MKITLTPKWKLWIGRNLFWFGVIFTILGTGLLFFGQHHFFGITVLLIGSGPLVLGILVIRNNWAKYLKNEKM